MSVELDRPLRAAEMKLELSMPILMPLSASKSGWEDSVATVSVQARASKVGILRCPWGVVVARRMWGGQSRRSQPMWRRTPAAARPEASDQMPYGLGGKVEIMGTA
jgi:hypothetical protein